jgi:hypothetical protein
MQSYQWISNLFLILLLAACGGKPTQAPTSIPTVLATIPTVDYTILHTQSSTSTSPPAPSPTPTMTSSMDNSTFSLDELRYLGRIAFWFNNTISYITPGDERTSPIVKLETMEQTWGPSWAPDGQSIVYDVGGSLAITTLDGSTTSILLGPTDNIQPAWSPVGNLIAFNSTQDMRPSPSGQAPVSDLFIIGVGGAGLQNLTTENTSFIFNPTWSPDGTKIAFEMDYQIYILDRNNGNQVNLTDNTCMNREPDWSASGRYIAFVSDCDGDYEIYMMTPDRSSGMIQLTDNLIDERDPTWSPDGRYIAFNQDLVIFILELGTREKVKLTAGYYPDWSSVNGSTCATGYTRLQPGTQARVMLDSQPVRARSGPTTAAEILISLLPGTKITIIGGPICAGELVFWLTDSDVIPGGIGWTAEGDGVEYWLEPYTP